MSHCRPVAIEFSAFTSPHRFSQQRSLLRTTRCFAASSRLGWQTGDFRPSLSVTWLNQVVVGSRLRSLHDPLFFVLARNQQELNTIAIGPEP